MTATVFDIVSHSHPGTGIPERTPMTTPEPQPSTPAQATLAAIQHADIAADGIANHLAHLGAVRELRALYERIVADPVLDEFHRLALKARDHGVDPAVFQGAMDMLGQALRRKMPVLPPGAAQDGANGSEPTAGTPDGAAVPSDAANGAAQAAQ